MSYVSNALAAVACGSHLGVRPRDAAAALSKMVLPPGRMTIRTKRGITFLDDAYNANPLSFESALETLAHLKTKKKRWVVAGDMLELGKTSRHWHEQVGRQCAGCGIDGIITLGTQARLMGRAAQAVGVAHVHARAPEDVVAHLRKVLNRGDVVLVKGSRGMRLEKVIAAFISS
jgi:UDP-N-acetylmuramyl pentapeptide synthase